MKAPSLLRSLGVGVVALAILFPKTTEAEVVQDYERMGESDDDGQRFGAIVVKGELVPSANAPGGWTLLRTYQNKSDEIAEVTLDERIETRESMYGARVSAVPSVALERTQKLRLGANEKKAIGTYLPEKLGESMTKAHRLEALSKAYAESGHWEHPIAFQDYAVSYLRPLAYGETAAPPMPRSNMSDVP